MPRYTALWLTMLEACLPHIWRADGERYDPADILAARFLSRLDPENIEASVERLRENPRLIGELEGFGFPGLFTFRGKTWFGWESPARKQAREFLARLPGLMRAYADTAAKDGWPLPIPPENAGIHAPPETAPAPA